MFMLLIVPILNSLEREYENNDNTGHGFFMKRSETKLILIKMRNK